MARLGQKKRPILAADDAKEARPSDLKRSTSERKEEREYPVLLPSVGGVKRAAALLEQMSERSSCSSSLHLKFSFHTRPKDYKLLHLPSKKGANTRVVCIILDAIR